MDLNKRKCKNIAALAIILFIEVLCYQFLWETKEHVHYIHLGLVNYLSLTLVGLVGYYALKADNAKWMLLLWILLYTGALMFLILLRVVDSWVYKISARFTFRDKLRVFFVSPLPLAMLLVLGMKLKKTTKNTQ